MPDLNELRAAALDAIRRYNLAPETHLPEPTGPIHWRMIIGDSESLDSIAPVCTATNDPTGEHVIANYPGGPLQDDTGVYDCCPTPWIEVGNGDVAAYLVALLNADTERAQTSTKVADPLPGAERTFLSFALDLAFDQMCSGDGFTDEDEAALASLRKLAGGDV